MWAINSRFIVFCDLSISLGIFANMQCVGFRSMRNRGSAPICSCLRAPADADHHIRLLIALYDLGLDYHVASERFQGAIPIYGRFEP